MAKKILVAYETAWGSTEEIAKFVGDELTKKGNVVEVERVGSVADIGGYDAVVLGCPIQNSAWLEGGVQFLVKHKEALKQKPLALFTVCMGALAGPEPIMKGTISPMLKKLPGIKPVSVGAFPGVLDYPRYPPPVQFMLGRALGARGLPTEGRHDFRNWGKIGAWVNEVNGLLGG